MQKIFITIVLFIIYIFGFGITLILVILFNRRLLGGTIEDKDTFWRNAEGYEPDLNDSLQQS